MRLFDERPRGVVIGRGLDSPVATRLPPAQVIGRNNDIGVAGCGGLQSQTLRTGV